MSFTLDRGRSQTIEMPCPRGKVATGGGYRWMKAPAAGLMVTGSYPNASLPDKWLTDVLNAGTSLQNVDLEVVVVCVVAR